MRKKNINLRLKAAIIEAGKSMKDVADLLETTKSNFSRKINGYFYFNEDEIEKIAEYLKKPVTDLFFDNIVTKQITNN